MDLVVPDSLLPRLSGGRVFPLSYQQEWPCVAGLLHPPVLQDPGYCLYLVIRLRGQVDAQVLQRALDEVVARQPALRTRFASTEENLAVQEESLDSRRAIVLRDERGEDPGAVIEAMTRPSIAFDQPPAVRCELAVLSSDEFILGLGVHHLACDATGVLLLAQDLARAYQACLEGTHLPPLGLSYGEVALWHRAAVEGRLESDLAWWRALAEGCAPAPLRLDHPFSPGVAAANVVLRAQLLDRAGAAGLQRFALRLRTSLFVVVLAAAEVAMGARKDTEDRLVMTNLDQRDHPATREMVGYFLNPVAIRFPMAHDVPVAQTLALLTRRVLDVAERAYVPTYRLADAIPEVLACLVGAREPGPIFVQLEPHAIPAEYRLGEAVGSFVASGVRGPTEPCLTLKFLPMADGSLELEVGYESAHFDASSIRNLQARVRGVLEELLAGNGAATPRELLSRLGGW